MSAAGTLAATLGTAPTSPPFLHGKTTRKGKLICSKAMPFFSKTLPFLVLFPTISGSGYSGGFAHGHNEDWSETAGRLYYYIKYTAAPGADFASCEALLFLDFPPAFPRPLTVL